MNCDLTDAAGAGTVQVEIIEVDGDDIEYEAFVRDYEFHEDE